MQRLLSSETSAIHDVAPKQNRGRRIGAAATAFALIATGAASCNAHNKLVSTPLDSLRCAYADPQYREVAGPVSSHVVELIFKSDNGDLGIEIKDGEVAVAQADYDTRTVSNPGAFKHYDAGQAIASWNEYTLVAGAWQHGATYVYPDASSSSNAVTAITEECASTIQRGSESTTTNAEHHGTVQWDTVDLNAPKTA
jgi:hypothetical protein